MYLFVTDDSFVLLLVAISMLGSIWETKKK